ncbi:GPI anchored cell wall protein [Lasiodiplodia theobromae]|uniref:GPI anchored cell wall protein n=1 Tax=Lasiodiplodia theobromae TaxID=45133 RepID=UPI0015C3B8EF|nr:GPI anchored cell wall protein [Lasiodiplodia theobromae]KAF4539344.1 GPI anchored cell wall protein [Lasiodiplodia theobromae]
MMKYALSPLAFTLGASAVALKRSDCCFQLTASGGASGSVGQLSDGQNRVGGGYQAATYCLNNGGITDSNGRGCILTPPTTQFQCDEGASPTTGFSVGENGQVTYKGDNQFYACPADDGEYNIYTEPVDDQDKCVKITLSTEGGKCASGGGQPSTPAASTPVPVSPSSAPPAPSTPVASSPEVVTTMTQTHYTTTCPTSESSAPPAASTPAPVVSSYASTLPPVESPPATTMTYTTSHTQTATSVYSVTSTAGGTPSTPSSSACPTDLAGDYQYPHLIVPVNASTPSQSYGTQYNGRVNTSPQVCTLFNFDIPQSYAGSTCSAVFLLPHKDELETSDYDLTPASGGKVSFALLDAPADQATAWDSVPAKKQDFGGFDIAAGTRFVVATAECQAGQTIAYEMCAQGGDLSFEWFQDWNPSPIGLFVRKC